MRKYVFLFCLLIVFPSFCLANELYGTEIIEYGIYKVEDKPKIIPNSEIPGGIQKKIKKSVLITNTDHIPAILNTKFGIRYLIKGKPDGAQVKTRTKWIYPEAGMRDPDTGRVYDHIEYSSTDRIGKPQYSGYSLEEEWELIPGEWILQVWIDNKKLIEKRFILYKPSGRPTPPSSP